MTIKRSTYTTKSNMMPSSSLTGHFSTGWKTLGRSVLPGLSSIIWQQPVYRVIPLRSIRRIAAYFLVPISNAEYSRNYYTDHLRRKVRIWKTQNRASSHADKPVWLPKLYERNSRGGRAFLCGWYGKPESELSREITEPALWRSGTVMDNNN